LRRAFAIAGPVFVFLLLTALTQVGGVLYLAAFAIVRWMGVGRRRLATTILTLVLYGAATQFLVPPLAATIGRVRLPCGERSPSLAPATKLTCVLNRGYVRKEVRELLLALGDHMVERFSGSRVTTLEASFPFFDGFPLLPHLSHHDGRKVDLAFFYETEGNRILSWSPSPLGYFVYEQPRPGEPRPCSARWSPLRWDFDWLQPVQPPWRLDEERTRAMIRWLTARPEVTRLFLEPHLAERLGVAGGKVRFQGCRAARHDDHLHVEFGQGT
jgi:hypothetical protein